MNSVLVVANYSAGQKKAFKYKKQIQMSLINYCKYFKFISIDELKDEDLSRYDTVIAVGGDGTISKVVSFIINTPITLGIIPTGTANLLAAKLGINSINDAIKVIERGHQSKINLIDVNNKLSVLRCGFGYDADIIAKTPQSIKNKFGYFSYFVAGVLFALRLKNKEYDLIIDGIHKKVSASCIIIANSGNMYKNIVSIAQNSSLNDNLIDVFILNTDNPILYFMELIKIIFNKKQNNKLAQYIQAKKITINNKYCISHIDGEKTKFLEDITFKISDFKLKIFSKGRVCLD